jgi:membrane protease subunit HflK
MERVLGGSDKLVYDGGASQQGVVPLLPLGDLAPRRQGPAGTSSPGGTTNQPGGVR